MADFLCHLHEDKGLASSTIEGYRTAISHTLKATTGQDVGKDSHLSSLVANFQRDCTRPRVQAPAWDLALVLGVLGRSPFEPLDQIDMKNLTLKTVFLVTLATGQRRSEVHALTRSSLQRREQWQSVTLYPDPQFIAKTQLADQGGQSLQGVTIPALKNFLGPGLNSDVKLCPVRALREYVKRTDKIRKGQKQLFISYQPGRAEEISKATISRWLKTTIITCYGEVGEEECQIFRVKAHQVRTMATSWAFHKNASMEKILLAGTWRSHTTFTSYYLKDLSVIRDRMLQLGPIVSALHVN